MIKRSKDYINILFLIFLVCYAAFALDFNMYTFYMGIPFGARIIVYAIYTGISINFLLYVYGDLDNYIANENYRIIRYEQRRRAYFYLLSSLAIKVLKHDSVMFLFWLISSICMQESFEMEGRIFFWFMLHYTVNVVIAVMQLNLEIIVSSKRALLLSVTYWVGSVVFLDCISQVSLSKFVMIVLLPNLSMPYRIREYGVAYEDVITMLFLILCFLIYMGGKSFQKKDII